MSRAASLLFLLPLLSVACSDSGEEEGTLSLSGMELSDGDGGDFALEHFTVSVEGIELARRSGTELEWVGLLEEGGWSVDLLSGASDGGFAAALPAGTYPYVYLKLGDEMTWQRSASGSLCPEGTSSSDDAVSSVLATPAALAADFGQVMDEETFAVLDDPDIAPREVHRDASDGYFWVIIEEVTVVERETTELFLAASPGSVEAGAACDDAPGKPFFLLGGADALAEAYR